LTAFGQTIPGSLAEAERLAGRTAKLLDWVHLKDDQGKYLDADTTDALQHVADQGIDYWRLDTQQESVLEKVAAAQSPSELPEADKMKLLGSVEAGEDLAEAFSAYKDQAVRRLNLSYEIEAANRGQQPAVTESLQPEAVEAETPKPEVPKPRPPKQTPAEAPKPEPAERKKLPDDGLTDEERIERVAKGLGVDLGRPARQKKQRTPKPKQAVVPEAKLPLALPAAPEKPGRAKRPETNVIPSSGEPIALPGPAAASETTAVVQPVRKGFRLEPEDLVTVSDTRVHRPDGKFMSMEDEAKVMAHEAQIRRGLKGWLAENKLVVLDDRNYARDPETGKRLTNADLLQISNTADFSREAYNERVLAQEDIAQDWKDLSPEARQAILANQRSAEPITDPTPKGLRARLKRVLGRAGKIRDDIKNHGVGAYLSAKTQGAVERLKAMEPRRRNAAVAAGALAVVGGGVVLFLAHKYGGHSGGLETIVPRHGGMGSTGPKGAPGAGHELLVTKGAGHGGGSHETLREVFTLDAPRGGVHDSISREMLEVAARQNITIDPSNAHFGELVNRVLDYNHLTEQQAEQLPVGFRFRIPHEIIEELTKSKN